MSEQIYLPDVNVLIALSDPKHGSHTKAADWHKWIGSARFCLCPVTESGFVRLTMTPQVGGRTISEAMLMLHEIMTLPNIFHLAVAPSWMELVAPIAPRLHGYRQVTDALLLGLAIQNNAILVTLDRSIQALAGEAYVANLLTLA